MEVNKVRNAFNNECIKNKTAAQSVVFKKMQRHLRRIKSEGMPKSPQTPNKFIEIFKSEKFLKDFGICESNNAKKFYITTVIEDKIQYKLFFSTPIVKLFENIDPNERHFFIDATFSIVPSCGYKQLLIIYFGHSRHVIIYNKPYYICKY